jgi:hypothetical protein
MLTSMVATESHSKGTNMSGAFLRLHRRRNDDDEGEDIVINSAHILSLHPWGDDKTMVQLIRDVAPAGEPDAITVTESIDSIMKLLDHDGRQAEKPGNKRPFSL